MKRKRFSEEQIIGILNDAAVPKKIAPSSRSGSSPVRLASR